MFCHFQWIQGRCQDHNNLNVRLSFAAKHAIVLDRRRWMIYCWGARQSAVQPRADFLWRASQQARGYCFPDLCYWSTLILGNVKLKTPQASATLTKYSAHTQTLKDKRIYREGTREVFLNLISLWNVIIKQHYFVPSTSNYDSYWCIAWCLRMWNNA